MKRYSSARLRVGTLAMLCSTAAIVAPVAKADDTSTAFNPAISLILDGGYYHYQNDPTNYHLPGFTLGNDAGLNGQGLAIGESEITLSSNVDQLFRAQMTASFGNHAGTTTTGIEEAFFETLGLGNGLTVRGGRFKSAVGYLNQQHAHAWDFADAPLVYNAFWGGGYNDDGVRASWIAPTDVFLEVGAEVLAGAFYPGSGKAASGAGARTLYVNLGGDLSDSQSWQAGASYYSANPKQRETATASDTVNFSGTSDVTGLNAVYKWAPDGNYKERFVKVQGEFFQRREHGSIAMVTSGDSADYRGTQNGYYIETVYQFHPQWRTGVRYDALHSDNRGIDLIGTNVLNEAGLDGNAFNPKRESAMLEWDPSEFSRVRFQFNHDRSYPQADNQFIVQYTMALGTHGAHTY